MNTHPTLSQFTRTWMAKDEEIRAAYERITKLEADLNECREYIDKDVAVVNGSDGSLAPNRALTLVCRIEETLNGRVQ